MVKDDTLIKIQTIRARDLEQVQLLEFSEVERYRPTPVGIVGMYVLCQSPDTGRLFRVALDTWSVYRSGYLSAGANVTAQLRERIDRLRDELPQLFIR